MCSFDIFVKLQQFGWNLKGGRFDPGLEFGRPGSRGWAIQLAAHGFVFAPHWHMVYRLPFSSYLAGSKGFPSDPDTPTNTVLEATASSGGNKKASSEMSVRDDEWAVHKSWEFQTEPTLAT